MKAKFFFVLLLAAFFCCPALGQSNALENGGFESGEAGTIPDGWFVPQPSTAAGYRVETSTFDPKEGAKCAVITLPGRQGPGFGNMMQTVDAKPFRGKEIRFRAAVRYDNGPEGGQTQLWLRVDRTNGQQGLFDNMGARPIRSSSWAFYEIVGRVDADAATINVGLMLIGSGKAWIDAASLRLSDEDEEPVVKPRAITDQGMVNLTAFTKLYGYIRHFHPSDAVEKADWNAWAMAGVVAIEDASNSAELANRLEAFFKPLAPTVQVFETGKAPAKLKMPADEASSIVTWQNIGFGGGIAAPNQTPYHSKRIFAKRTKDSPDPATPFEADLGGGVSCRVPLALFAAGESSLPHRPNPPSPKGIRTIATGNDRTTRLADVVIAWNVFEHFYPYFDVTKPDWPAVLAESLKSAATDASSREFLNTLRRLVASAKDGHGYVGHASDDGLAQPPLLAGWVEGKLVVTTVGPGVDHIALGDEIVSIDGKMVESLWSTIEPTIPGATEQWRRYRGQTALLAGPDGSTIALGIKHGSEAASIRTLKRELSNQLREKRPKAIQEIKVGIWYFDMDGSRANPQDYSKALRDLASAQGVVFDMRGYPNEIATDILTRVAKVPITSALWNIPVVTKPDHKDFTFQQSRWPLSQPQVPHFRGKIAFITDGRAISYAESIMGIVENYKLGAIVGEPTAGTNGNVNPFALPGDYTVVFTGMKVLKYDGSQHHGIGILPTVPVHRTIAGVAAGKDELLDKAVAVVSGG